MKNFQLNIDKLQKEGLKSLKDKLSNITDGLLIKLFNEGSNKKELQKLINSNLKNIYGLFFKPSIKNKQTKFGNLTYEELKNLKDKVSEITDSFLNRITRVKNIYDASEVKRWINEEIEGIYKNSFDVFLEKANNELVGLSENEREKFIYSKLKKNNEDFIEELSKFDIKN